MTGDSIQKMECPSCGHEFLAGDDSCGSCHADLTTVRYAESRLGSLHRVIIDDPLSRLDAAQPILLRKTDTVARAVALMKEQRQGSVIVVEEDGSLAGIFTERDLVRSLGPRQFPAPGSAPASLDSVRLADVMTPGPHALAPDDTIASALHSMAVGGYRHVPLVRDGRPAGFVSIRGILGYIARNAL